MDLRKGWEALKARLRGWYSKVFGNEDSEDVPVVTDPDVQTSSSETYSSEISAQENSALGEAESRHEEENTETASQDTSVASDGIVSTVCEKLEHLRRNRQLVVRKKNNRMEWQVAGADFTDAYLLLLSIPEADIRQLRHRTVADEITYHLELPGGMSAELMDKTLREDTIAVLRLMADGRCMLKINFINNQN